MRNFIARSLITLSVTIGAALCASDGLAQGFPADARVDRLFAEWDKPASPGCAVGVIRDGKFIYERGYGMANLDYDIPSSPRMNYYIGSDSKQFTAASIGLLVLEGKISLDDDIRRYFPDMPDYGKIYGAPVTVRNLIHHTSGLREIYTLMGLAGLPLENIMTDDSALALITRQKGLDFKPGTEYSYSNSGYWLLGQIIERVTGKPLRVFADERIFTPLGMTNTHFHDDPGHVMKNRAMSYEPDGAGGFRISYLQNFDKTGAGGLYSTVEDLKKWDENFYSHEVGGEALQKLIHTRGVLANGDTLTYAFGNTVSNYRGLRTDEHGGSMMGYKAYILRFPDQRLSVIETCNLGSINPGPIARKVAEVYLGNVMGPVPDRQASPERRSPPTVTLSAAELERVVGDYYSDELDATYRLAVKDGRLVLGRPNAPDAALRAEDRDTFRAPSGGSSGRVTLRFDRSGKAAPASFTVETGRVTGIRFRRK